MNYALNQAIDQKPRREMPRENVASTVGRLHELNARLGPVIHRLGTIADALMPPAAVPQSPNQQPAGGNDRPMFLVGSLGYLESMTEMAISELEHRLARIENALGIE